MLKLQVRGHIHHGAEAVFDRGKRVFICASIFFFKFVVVEQAAGQLTNHLWNQAIRPLV